MTATSISSFLPPIESRPTPNDTSCWVVGWLHSANYRQQPSSPPPASPVTSFRGSYVAASLFVCRLFYLHLLLKLRCSHPTPASATFKSATCCLPVKPITSSLNQISSLPTALLFVSANLGRHELSLSQLKVRLSLLFLLQLCWVFHHIRIWGFNNMDDNGYPVNPIIREIERWSLFSFLSNFMSIQLGSINWLMQSFLFHVSNNSRPFSLHFLPIIFFLW